MKFNVQLVPVFPLDVLLEHPEQKYLVRAAAMRTTKGKKVLKVVLVLPESPIESK